MSRPQEMSDEELSTQALQVQSQNPMLSEGAIMGLLGRGREYLADRAKDSEELSRTRKRMTAIRERAWIEFGIKHMTGEAEIVGQGQGARVIFSNSSFRETTFIWMTRNILGWRDREDSAKGSLSNQGSKEASRLVINFGPEEEGPSDG